MQGFFAKTMVVGLVAGGFYMTGDLQSGMERVSSWARGESSADPETATEVVQLEPLVTPADSPAVTVASTSPSSPPPPVTSTSATVTSHAPDSSTPAQGVPLPELAHQQVDIASLRAGDRILARTTYEVVAFDLIDPSSGEAVEHRHALLSPDVATAAALTTPRRVVLPAQLVLGQPAAFAAVSGRPDAVPPPVGSIVALGIERPLD